MTMTDIEMSLLVQTKSDVEHHIQEAREQLRTASQPALEKFWFNKLVKLNRHLLAHEHRLQMLEQMH